VLTDTKRPLATAAMFDWAGLIDAATPWIDFAIEQMNEPTEEPLDEDDFDVQMDDGPAPNPITAAVAGQVKTVLDVLKVVQTITSETYVEGDAMVSHTLIEMKDVE